MPALRLVRARRSVVVGVALTAALASTLTTTLVPAAGGTAPVTAAPRPSAPPAAAAAEGRCDRGTTGDRTVRVRFRGTAYPVVVHVPRGLRRGAVPLVLDLHPSSGNAASLLARSRMREVAAEEGFVVAAPQGVLPSPETPDGWFWNVPGVPTTAGQLPPADSRDDVAYLSRVIDEIVDRLCTDPSRTYVTGFSGGARMTSALACRTPERIAAIAPVAGLRAGRPDPDDVTVPEVEDCTPDRPVPVLAFHGRADTTNPYAGSEDLRWGYAVPVALQTWARLDGCRRGPQVRTIDATTSVVSYRRCEGRAEVRLVRISDGQHLWPGSADAPDDVDASRMMAQFFADHRRR